MLRGRTGMDYSGVGLRSDLYNESKPEFQSFTQIYHLMAAWFTAFAHINVEIEPSLGFLVPN